MTQEQQILNEDRELMEKVLAVVKSNWWARYISLCKAHLMSVKDLDAGGQRGIIALAETIEHMPDVEKSPGAMPSMHLTHSIDVRRSKTERKDTNDAT